MLRKFTIIFVILFFGKTYRLFAHCDSTLFFQGAALQQKGEIDGAISKHTELIGQCPTFSIAYFNRGVCYYHKNDHAKGYPDLQAAIGSSANKANMAFLIGSVFFMSAHTYTPFEKSIIPIIGDFEKTILPLPMVPAPLTS